VQGALEGANVSVEVGDESEPHAIEGPWHSVVC
jgi:hypothetical protein